MKTKGREEWEGEREAERNEAPTLYFVEVEPLNTLKLPIKCGTISY
jgi:hypothetical protein